MIHIIDSSVVDNRFYFEMKNEDELFFYLMIAYFAEDTLRLLYSNLHILLLECFDIIIEDFISFSSILSIVLNKEYKQYLWEEFLLFCEEAHLEDFQIE